MNYQQLKKDVLEESLNLDMLVTDDTGQEFKAVVTVNMSELENALRLKGFKLSKIQ